MMRFVLYNYTLKRYAHALINSKLLNSLSPYKIILKRRINKIIGIYVDRPQCVRIENTNICNAKCITCPRELMTRKIGIMDENLYERIISQCADMGVENINLHNYGEPLIDKHLPDKIKLAKKTGIKTVTTNSNASLLNKDISEKLLCSGLDTLFVSIDALTEQTYSVMRKGLKYDVLMENLSAFIEMKNTMKSSTQLVVNFVTTKENRHESGAFYEFWKHKADMVSVSYAHNWTGKKKDTMANKRLQFPCKLPFSDLVILWDGAYALCCADFDGTVDLGTVDEVSLAQFWRGNTSLQKYRQEHQGNNGASISPCNACTLNTIWWI